MNARQLPNLLTFSRVLIVIPFLIYFPDEETRGLWLIGLLVLCELTDIFDGMLARAMKSVSNFGKIFDPFADSIYRLSAFLALFMAGLFPWYAFMFLVFRDVAVAYIRVFEATHGHVRAARTSGKIKAIVQGVGLIVLALVGIYGSGLVDTTNQMIINISVTMIVGVTLWSLVDYSQPLFKRNSSSGEDSAQ